MDKLSNELKSAGLVVNGLPNLTGKIVRCGTVSKPKGKNGWYVGGSKLIRGQEYTYCSMGDWSQSDEALATYKSWQDDNLSAVDRGALKKYQDAAREQAERARLTEQKAAAEKAQRDWASCEKTGTSRYLKSKGAKGFGIRYGSSKKDGRFIVIPLRDSDGNITSLQRIYDKVPAWLGNNKCFTKNGKKRGCSHLVGELSQSKPLCFAEGYATAATIHQATNYPVAVCFDAGNLGPVISQYRQAYPDKQFVICADNDQWKQDNTGVNKACEAAKKHGCCIAIPDFTGLNTESNPTDFNDLQQLADIGRVKQAIEHCLAEQPAEASPKADASYPTEQERPCYRVYEKGLKVGDRSLQPGTYYHRMKPGKGGDEAMPVDDWICSPLHVEAVTHDLYGNNFGRYLNFKPTRGNMRHWSMPMSLLKGSGDELRGELLSMGLRLNVRDKSGLLQYINDQNPSKTLEIATQTGWYKGAFLLPEQTIGSRDYFYQSEYFNSDIPYRQQGTLIDWQQNVARYCPGNPLLILAVSSAFSGALLRKAHHQGGGFHLFGSSSKGKSTGLFAACSVWGNGQYKRSWRATGNGLEATAALFNDSLLALDEISECNGKEVGNIIYSLGNGIGKARAKRNGSAKAAQQWKVIVLSTGERTVEATMHEAGQQIKAGQEMRLLSIPIFGKHGAFNELHDTKDGRELSDVLQNASLKYYGVAGIEYLKQLVQEVRSIGQLANEYTAILTEGKQLNSQALRAAKRFGLVALAGELATEYGVTGWEYGEAISGVSECFNQWLNYFGRGDIEEQQVLQSIKNFIDRFGDSRFSWVKYEETQVNDRAGYWVLNDTGERVYLFNKVGLIEALRENGLDYGLKILKKHGWLTHEQGRNTKQFRIHGTRKKLYCIEIKNDNSENLLEAGNESVGNF